MVDSSQISSGKTDKVEKTRQWKSDDITDSELDDLIALAVKESLKPSSGNPNLDRTIRGISSSSYGITGILLVQKSVQFSVTFSYIL